MVGEGARIGHRTGATVRAARCTQRGSDRGIVRYGVETAPRVRKPRFSTAHRHSNNVQVRASLGSPTRANLGTGARSFRWAERLNPLLPLNFSESSHSIVRGRCWSKNDFKALGENSRANSWVLKVSSNANYVECRAMSRCSNRCLLGKKFMVLPKLDIMHIGRYFQGPQHIDGRNSCADAGQSPD